MKSFKRVMAMLLTLIMVLSLAACGQPTNQTEAPVDKTEASADKTEAPADDKTEAPTEAEFDPKSICEGVTITIAVAESSEVIDWNTNAVTLMIEEALGVNLEFQAYASADYYDKINVMVNGGDKLPDIIFSTGDTTGISPTNYTNWAVQEAIIPLNEFYDNPDLSYYMNLACEKYGVNIPSLLADADGNIWGGVKWMQFPTNEVPYKLWINSAYAKELGFDELPTTTDEFYELCKAFAAAGDVNGNGLDDELCLTGRGDKLDRLYWFQFLMSPFAYAWDNYYLDVENGELSFAYTSDGWKEGLKYIKRFIDEGLIDSTILTQDKESYQALTTDPMGGRPNILAEVGYQTAFTSSVIDESRNAKINYHFVSALEGPNGRVEAVYIPTNAYVGAVITADCENPEAAFLVLDMMYSEVISISNRYGQQGVDWDYWENVDEAKLPHPKASYKGRLVSDYPEPIFVAYSDGTYWGKGNPQNAGYMQAGVCVQGQNLYWGIADVKDAGGDESLAKGLAINNRYYESIHGTLKVIPEESVITLPMTTKESEDVNTIQLTLDKYLFESIGAFLSGQWDIDTYWDTYLAELDKIGIDDALAIYQTSYDRTK